MLGNLEYHHPGTHDALIKSQEVLRKQVHACCLPGDLRVCRDCGELCNGEICRACRLLHSPKH